MPAIFRIIWSMRFWITSICNAPFSVEKRHFALNERCTHTRVTGEENGQMRLEEIERQGCFYSGWMIPASGSAITRCLELPASALPVGTGGGAAGNPPAAAESWMAQGFPSEAIHHALRQAMR